MKVEVEVISNEIIKPSSPTPDHLRNYQFSLLDQLTPKTYNPLVLFYDSNNDDFSETAEISVQIKKSLSEILTLYYPLAGRVKNDRSIDCNDEGISFSEARVNSALRLTDLMQNPNPSELANLLPFELHELTEFPLGVRLNIFHDGGVAVGVCISHQLADALSCVSFIKNWAAVSRSDGVEKPQFVSAELFPAKDELDFDPNIGITRTAVSRRFVFEYSKIEAIRARYGDGEDLRRPTRIEALSTFIWSRFLAANRGEFLQGPEKAYALIHPVNIRRKLDPPISDEAFGNIARFAITILPASMDLASLEGDAEHYGRELVRQIREAIQKVDVGYVKKVQKGEDQNLEIFKEESKRLMIRGGELIALGFTSLCRFPLYEADFGWGEPLWVSSATLSFNNVVTFMDAKKDNAIEVYVGLKEEQLAKLEADEELLNFVSA